MAQSSRNINVPTHQCNIDPQIQIATPLLVGYTKMVQRLAIGHNRDSFTTEEERLDKMAKYDMYPVERSTWNQDILDYICLVCAESLGTARRGARRHSSRRLLLTLHEDKFQSTIKDIYKNFDEENNDWRCFDFRSVFILKLFGDILQNCNRWENEDDNFNDLVVPTPLFTKGVTTSNFLQFRGKLTYFDSCALEFWHKGFCSKKRGTIVNTNMYNMRLPSTDINYLNTDELEKYKDMWNTTPISREPRASEIWKKQRDAFIRLMNFPNPDLTIWVEISNEEINCSNTNGNIDPSNFHNENGSNNSESENNDENVQGENSDGNSTSGSNRNTRSAFDKGINDEDIELNPREKATMTDLVEDPFAAVDHITLETCTGLSHPFHESKFLPGSARKRWAEAFGNVLRELSSIANAIHSDQNLLQEYEIKLERRIKMFFLFPCLILRKIKGQKNVSNIIKQRLARCRDGDYLTLIEEFETDIAKIQSVDPNSLRSDKPQDVRNYERMIDLIKVGELSRASKALLSKGMSDAAEEEIISQMRRKFPTRKEDIPTLNDEDFDSERATLDKDLFRKTILGLRREVSPGPGNLRNEHLSALIFNPESKVSDQASAAFDHLFEVAETIVSGRLPWYFYVAWTTTSLSAVNKLDPETLEQGQTMDCRPVCKGNSLRKAIIRTLYEPYMESFEKTGWPCQFGTSKSGISQFCFSLFTHLEARPDFVVIALDIKNAFNEVTRAKVLEKLRKHPALKPLLYYNWRESTVKSPILLGSGPSATVADFFSEEGQQQGAVQAGINFNLAIDTPNKITQEKLEDGCILGVCDDTTIIGRPEVVFPIIGEHKEELAKIGLELNINKTKCYIHEDYRNEEYHRLRIEAGINEGVMEDDNGNKLYGMKICSIPIGEDAYKREWLQQKSEEISQQITTVGEKADPITFFAEELPGVQCLWLLLSNCLQYKSEYWLRHLPPSKTKEFSKTIDVAINQLISKCFQVDYESLSDFTKERMRLPIRMKGIGIRSTEERRFSQFLGGIKDGLIPLISRKTGDNLEYKGRINVDILDSWIGSNPFGDECIGWKTLLEKNSEIGEGIKEAWNHVCNQFRDIQRTVNEVTSTILHGDCQYACFIPESNNGTTILHIPKGSLTHKISKILEEGKAASITNNIKNNNMSENTTKHERMSFYYSNTYSSEFLRALISKGGIMMNDTFVTAVNNYLGLPIPILKPFVGEKNHYIGRSGKLVDEYGIEVKNAQIRGGHYQRGHRSIQYLLNDMCRKAHLYCELEPSNMFTNLPNEIAERYYASISKEDQIRPDFRIHNYKTVKRGFGIVEQSLVGEVKTVRVGSNNRYCHSRPSIQAVEKRDKDIRSEYNRKSKKLDEKYSNGEKYFETAIKKFAKGGVMPFVIGAYGEINQEAQTFVSELATFASRHKETARMTPASFKDAGQKDPFQVILGQFRTILGCMTVKIQAELILQRINYIRSSKIAAETTAKHGPPRGRFWEYSPSWFNNRENEDAFHKFNTFTRSSENNFYGCYGD
jgi:hypothetical protein